MPEWLFPVLIGLIFGVFVSGINHLILLQGIKRGENESPLKARNIIMVRYGIRFITNVAALFLVYRNMPMLIGAAVGLTFNKNLMFIKHLLGNTRKKGVN